MKKFLEKSGITMIALIVTIIVLLILAGIGISAIVGDNGLINKTQNAKEMAEKSQAREDLTTAWAYILNDYDDELNDIDVDVFNNYLKKSSGIVEEFSLEDDESALVKFKVKDTGNKYEFLLDLGGAVYDEYNSGKNLATFNRTLTGSTDITKMTYKNPVIPQGFYPEDTDEAKWKYKDSSFSEVEDWNKGLVIKDDLDNEFVWVPCTLETVDSSSPIVQYSKNLDYPKNSGISDIEDANDSTNEAGDGVTYSAIPVTETTQIGTYGGFYVARFEAGLDTASSNSSNNNYSGIPVSKYGSKVWNNIDYTHSYVAAQKMINNLKYGNNKSGLITGTQWDTIMKWFEKSGIGVGGTMGTQNWGTYKDIEYSYSGTQNNSFFTHNGEGALVWSNGAFSHEAYDKNQSIDSDHLAHYHASGLNITKGYQKNIADLGGNLWEWISEQCTVNNSSYRVYRGGAAGNSATRSPASYRGNSSTTNTGCSLGFRVVLYIQ